MCFVSMLQVTTYHYDISEIKSEDAQGLRGMQIQANPNMKHWKLYLVQVSKLTRRCE